MISASVTYLKKAVSQKYKNACVSASFNTSAEASMLTASISEALMRTCTIDLFVFQVVYFWGIGDMES